MAGSKAAQQQTAHDNSCLLPAPCTLSRLPALGAGNTHSQGGAPLALASPHKSIPVSHAQSQITCSRSSHLQKASSMTE